LPRWSSSRALRLIGAAFLALACYILVQAGYTLCKGSHPHHSAVGIAWLAATCVAVTLIDAYLAGAILVGLLLNAALGWWWADPLAGVVIVYYGGKEGWVAWRGRRVSAPTS
jgi:hypothetical protein